MRTRRFLIATVAVAAGFACAVAAQRQLDVIHTRTFHEELLYLPSERLLDHFTAGMGSIVADVLWIQCIQYTAEHFKGDGKFTWLNHMCNLITRLDPYYVAVYRYGGIFLASVKADDDASIDLLEKGMVRNPFAWELPYEIAMTWLLNRGGRPEAPIEAARYLGMAVETGNAPRFVIDVAAALQAAHDLTGIERAMWENQRTSGDTFLRDLAERKLIELDLRETCAALNNSIAAYRTRHNQPPAKIDDLVADGLTQSMPIDPLGGTFFIDSAGKAQNSTVLEVRTTRDLNNLRNAVGAYRKAKGRWPASLNELIDAHIMSELPPHPRAGRDWQYDPATGEVN